jgi:hypothetical protein
VHELRYAQCSKLDFFCGGKEYQPKGVLKTCLGFHTDSHSLSRVFTGLVPIHSTSIRPPDSQFSDPDSNSRSHFPRAAAPRLVLAQHRTPSFRRARLSRFVLDGRLHLRLPPSQKYPPPVHQRPNCLVPKCLVRICLPFFSTNYQIMTHRQCYSKLNTSATSQYFQLASPSLSVPYCFYLNSPLSSPICTPYRIPLPNGRHLYSGPLATV